MNAGGIILDVDGTLLDSNDAQARSWVDVLAQGGQHVSFERVRPLIGMGADKLLPLVTGVQADSPAGQEIVRQRREIFTRDYFPHVWPFPDVRPLVAKMREAGLTVVVASSAGPEELRPLLDHAGVADLIQDATPTDGSQKSKPDPDIVHAALVRTGLAADRVLMLGDTPYDIEAARRLGIGTIALRCGGHWSEQDLAGALAIYDHPSDLLKYFDDSPIAALAMAGSVRG